MAFRKFTRSEEVEVLSPEQHQAAGSALNEMGKTSASQLSESEKESFNIALQSGTFDLTD
jgi:hypothetical protein